MRPDRTRSILRAALLLSVVCLAACAGGPGVQRYVLPLSEEAVKNPAEPVGVLRIAPLRLSGLIDRRGLLMQLSEIEVAEASQHQWAEDLAPQLARSLRAHLSSQLDGWRVQSASLTPAQGLLLIVQVDQFQGRFDGQAVVSGHWQLLNQQRQAVASREFLLLQPLQRDGYAELVRSLDRAWQALAAQISDPLLMQTD